MRDDSLPELFNLADWLLDARVAEGWGERVALRLPDRTLTYRGVQALADRFAAVLQGLGVRREERIFLALPDGADYVGALFGNLKVGAVVVMLNAELAPQAVAALFDYLSPRLADHVARKLQPYEAPRAIHLVTELPRTHLGKIDRGALKRPAGVDGAGR